LLVINTVTLVVINRLGWKCLPGAGLACFIPLSLLANIRLGWKCLPKAGLAYSITLCLLVNNRIGWKCLPGTNGLSYFITLSLLTYLLTYIRLGWKCLPATNALACLVIPISDVEKSFVGFTPESNSIKTFYGHNLRMFIISWCVCP
jgi:hypothetical protein